MRNLKESGLIHNSDYTKFPFGGIKNETPTDEGTPVVEEIYGDVLSNIYEYLKDRNIAFNNLQDNAMNGHQFVEALRKNVNILNDQEKILTKINNFGWMVDLDFNLIIDKYFFFARASDDFNSEIPQSIKGVAPGLVFNFLSPSGFKSGDELLIICDLSGFRAYSIYSNKENEDPIIYNIFGTPIPYTTNLKEIWYSEDGIVFSDKPKLIDVKSIISNLIGDDDIKVYDIFEFKNHFICFVYRYNENKYSFFGINSINNEAFEFIGFSSPTNNTISFNPYSYFDNGKIYVSNDGDNSPQDNLFRVYDVFLESEAVFLSYSTQLNQSFIKTTNLVVKGEKIFTFIKGDLKSFDLIDGSKADLGQYDSFVGLIFKVKDDVFYTNGEVAKKWSLPV